jgi:hypothetical protein
MAVHLVRRYSNAGQLSTRRSRLSRAENAVAARPAGTVVAAAPARPYRVGTPGDVLELTAYGLDSCRSIEVAGDLPDALNDLRRYTLGTQENRKMPFIVNDDHRQNPQKIRAPALFNRSQNAAGYPCRSGRPSRSPTPGSATSCHHHRRPVLISLDAGREQDCAGRRNQGQDRADADRSHGGHRRRRSDGRSLRCWR